MVSKWYDTVDILALVKIGKLLDEWCIHNRNNLN